jgi:tripartite-type tricarboxylate transporter receptor subunit TctC
MSRFRFKSSINIFIAAVALCGIVIGSGAALAGEYPEKSVKLIVPWKAGGGTDALMRIVAHYATGDPRVGDQFPYRWGR